MKGPELSRTHPAVTVQIGPWEAEIDVAIAPLIRELWIAGIETSMSCQENDLGKIWIEFPAVEQLVKFLNIVAQFELGSETLYNRMVRVLSSKDFRADWEYELFPADAALVWPQEDRGETEFGSEGPADFFFTCCVHFPPGDLPIVFQRLQAHNAQVAEHLSAANSALAHRPGGDAPRAILQVVGTDSGHDPIDLGHRGRGGDACLEMECDLKSTLGSGDKRTSYFRLEALHHRRDGFA